MDYQTPTKTTTPKSRSSEIPSSRSGEEDKDVPKIKFKLSKPEEGGPSSPSPMARVCEYCGKEFSNGKALGGHIRIHTQALKKKGMVSKQPLITDQENLDREAIENRMCPICDRVFPSVKSLFGHMRFHPERSYRGERNYSLSSASADEEENPNSKTLIIDLMKDLPNWARTDKRGRGSTCEAARNLIKLASAGSSGRFYETATIHNVGCPSDIDKKGKTLVLSSSNERVDGPPKGRVRFVCRTCGRVFPTFQALGGHRSSHNKDKSVSRDKSASRDNLNYLSRSLSASSTEAGLEKKTGVGGGGPHRCEICQRNFPSGQALGGHKRCHWATTGSGSGAKNSEDLDDQASQVGPDRGSGLGSGSREPMEIDLNEIPSMEVDEDGSVNGNS